MPLLRKGVLVPSLGIDFSKPSEFINEQKGFPQNMRYYRGEMRKRPGKDVVGGIVADSTSIMGLGKLDLSNGSKYLVRASKAKLEKYNTATEAWNSIAITPFSGGDDDFFSFVTVTENDLLLITNGVDSIRKWTGSGNNALLGGSPPLAKYMTYLSPYVILANIVDLGNNYPWKVQWCDTNAPENWSTGNSGEALLSHEPSPIQNILKLNEFAAVYKRDSLYLGRRVETSDIIYFGDPIKTGIGLSAPRAVVEAEGLHYFMGANDFYVWNGNQPLSIGSDVRDEVFSRVDRSKINRCFAVHVQEQNEVWFAIVLSGNDWPTEIWKYNYRLGFWYYDTCAQLTSAVKWERTNSLAWDDAQGTWDSQQGIWDDGVSISAWEDIIFGLSTGYTHRIDYTTTDDNGVAVASHFISKDYTGDTLEFNKRWLQLDIWARGPGKLYVDYSTDYGSTWTNIPYTSTRAYIDMDGTNSKYEMYFDILADKIRFRFRNAESGETFYLRNFYPYYSVQDQIQSYR